MNKASNKPPTRKETKMTKCIKCGAPGKFFNNRDKPRKIVWFLSGRKAWGGGEETYQVRIHPIERKNLCYYHHKMSYIGG